jgi:hypothetical protein
MKRSLTLPLLSAALVAACGVAIVAVFLPVPTPSGATVSPLVQAEFRVAWRVPLIARAERPCPVVDGWVVADAAGGVMKVTLAGRVQWRVAFSNEVFVGGVEASASRVAVASEGGRVFCLDSATGGTIWKRDTDARFQHAPLAGFRNGESVLWLVSQEDGRLFCLSGSDGSVIWVTEATNRCDGEPVAWSGRIAYGNCDGAVYLYDSMTGKSKGSVEVGADDQMAGGIVALESGRLVTGTRSGSLVVINPETLSCEAKVKVSESEAFVTPAVLSSGVIAMGSEEGQVTLWRLNGQVLSQVGCFTAGTAVKGLESVNGRFFALAGATLSVIDSLGRLVQQMSLGDDVGRLSVLATGELACVADGALVCVKGGDR